MGFLFFFEKLESVMKFSSFAIALVTLCLSAWLLILHQTHVHERTLLEIEKARIDNTLYGTRYQEVYSALSVFNEEINQLSKIDQVLVSVPSILKTVVEALPEGIEVTAYTYKDEDLTLKLTGVAKNRETLLLMENQLKAIPFVEAVIAPLSNYDLRENVSFTVDLQLLFSDLPRYNGFENS